MSSAEKKEMVEIGTVLGEEYIKQYYNADFILKDYEIISPYIKGLKAMKISQSQLNTIIKKEISGVTGPDWFIDSRNPKID